MRRQVRPSRRCIGHVLARVGAAATAVSVAIACGATSEIGTATGVAEREPPAANDLAPALAPGSAHAAFIRDYAGTARDEVIVISTRTGAIVSRTRAAAPATIEWSPDAKQLAVGERAQVRILQRNGTLVRVLRNATAPSWSPDGAHLAVVGISARPTVKLVRGNNKERVVLRADVIPPMAWTSVDLLVVARARGTSLGLWVIETATGNGAPFAGGLAVVPKASAAADLLVFARPDGVYVTPALGGHERRVVELAGASPVGWSPALDSVVVYASGRVIVRGRENFRVSVEGVSPDPLTAADISSDGMLLLIAARDKCPTIGMITIDLTTKSKRRLTQRC